MTASEMQKRVELIIAEYTENEERAHGMEDGLLWEFVTLAAADGNALAKVLLELNKTVRNRWYM